MLHITNKTRRRLPKIPFETIKDSTLGQGYELSLAFVGNKISKTINKKYRNKNAATNILSFPLSKKEGEIIIDLKTTELEAQKLKQQINNRLVYIFIHGLVHLKGFDHGSRMEREEEKIRRKFGEKQNSYRY